MLEGLWPCISPERIEALQIESWLSGRKRHPAKVKSSERGTVGSNPTGSAQRETHAHRWNKRNAGVFSFPKTAQEVRASQVHPRTGFCRTAEQTAERLGVVAGGAIPYTQDCQSIWMV